MEKQIYLIPDRREMLKVMKMFSMILWGFKKMDVPGGDPGSN